MNINEYKRLLTKLYKDMRITTWLIVCIAILLLVQSYIKLIIQTHSFIETNCIEGHVSQLKNSNVIECIACHNFMVPISSKSTGYLIIDNNQQSETHQQTKDSNRSLLVRLWIQQTCLDYECRNLLIDTNQQFVSKTTMVSRKYTLHSQLLTSIDQSHWKSDKIQYSNELNLNNQQAISLANSFQKLLIRLIGPIMSVFMYESQHYGYSMAIRFRYQVSKDFTEWGFQPTVKLYEEAQPVYVYLLLSGLIAFTVFFKQSMQPDHLQDNSRLPFLEIVISLGFILPELISVISLVAMALNLHKKQRHHIHYSKWHFISLLSYSAYLIWGYIILAVIATKISLFINYTQSSSQSKSASQHTISKTDCILIVLLLVVNHWFTHLQCLTLMSPQIVFALSYQAKRQPNYIAVSNNKPNIYIQEIQQIENYEKN